MDKGDVLIALIAALPGLLVGAVSLYVAVKKNPHEIARTKSETEKTKAETEKTKAEADSIHAQVADRWAEHVTELEGRIENLTITIDEDRREITGLRLDITQVRRENEMYRKELAIRDQVINDLKDWAERLLQQLRKHAPHINPEQYRASSVAKFYDTAASNGS